MLFRSKHKSFRSRLGWLPIPGHHGLVANLNTPRTDRRSWGDRLDHCCGPSLDQETLLFSPAVPQPDALRTVLAFPSTYSVGITSLGFQVVWATLARRPDVAVRRLFTDRADPPLPRGQLDLFGISLSWELDGPVLLELLEQQRIPLWSHQRSADDPIVFGGGPVLTANPEPLAPFLDAVLLGEIGRAHV